MGIYIKGMEMPKSCKECLFCFVEAWCCLAEREDILFDATPDWCPFIEVPEPHGRLIDADALKEQINTTFWSEIGAIIDNAPTVSADRPHGEWVIRDDMPKLDNTYSIECSECGQLMFGHYNDDNPNYCPNCGALMLKGGDTK